MVNKLVYVIVRSPISVPLKHYTSDGRADHVYLTSTYDGYFRIGPLRHSPWYDSATKRPGAVTISFFGWYNVLSKPFSSVFCVASCIRLSRECTEDALESEFDSRGTLSLHNIIWVYLPSLLPLTFKQGVFIRCDITEYASFTTHKIANQ